MPANPQVTDEMVEKAARAICLAEGYDSKELDTIGSYSHQELWKDGRPKARAALEAALAGHVVGWRDIESAPKDGTPVLLWWDKTPVISYFAERANFKGWQQPPMFPVKVTDKSAWNPTHWMPLPAAPLPQKEG